MSKLDNLQQINTNVPRETLVYLADGLVIKRPVDKKNKTILNTWLGKQKQAKDVSDAVLEAKNKNYFVPRTLEISSKEYFVVEERAVGKPLTSSYVETLPQKDVDIIYKGLAHFINDINQSKQVLTQKETFDSFTSVMYFGDISIKDLANKLKDYIPETDLQSVIDAKEWFDVASDNDASIVFAHGDMNEHNIFFDQTTKKLSIIDFADSKYQNADYMFNVDFARLGWLDTKRLIKEYEALPKKQKVNVINKPEIKNMRNALYNFKNSASEFLHNPKLATKIRIEMIKQEIEKIKKLLNEAYSENKFQKGTILLKEQNQIKDLNNIVKTKSNTKKR